MRVRSDSTDIQTSRLGKDFDFSKLKFKVFHHDWMVMVVVEEHNISLMLKAVCYIVSFVIHTLV